MSVGSEMPGTQGSAWHWRQAMQLAAQVPPDEDDAWRVLECVREILKLSFAEAAPELPLGDQVLRFPAGASNRPSRRARSSGSPSGLPK
jgi:hypothetical protein